MNVNPNIAFDPSDVTARTAVADLSGLNVVHVVRQFAPMVGGLEDFVRNLAIRQARSFNSVRIVTLDRLFTDPDTRLPADQTIDGVEVRRIPFFGSTRYPLAPGVFGALGGADLVHVHAIEFFFDALALMRAFHRHPIVATTHGGFFHTSAQAGLKKLWFNSVTRLSASQYRAIACCSQSDYDLFAKVARDKVCLIENGVDLEKFADSAASSPQKTLVTIGRFSANKRIPRLLDVLKELVTVDPDWSLNIVGSPSDLTLEGLMSAIEERGLANAVRVHIGLSDEQLRDVMKHCSLFVSASDYEGFGIAMIEAMSAGLVPVVHPNDAFRGLAGKHEMVRLADFARAESAARAVVEAHQRLVQNPAVRAVAMASAQRHSWSATLARYDEMYRSALGG